MAYKTVTSFLHQVGLAVGSKSWRNNIFFIRYPTFSKTEYVTNYEFTPPFIPNYVEEETQSKRQVSLLRTVDAFSENFENNYSTINTPSSQVKVPGIRKISSVEFNLTNDELNTLLVPTGLLETLPSATFSDLSELPHFDMIWLSLSDYFLNFVDEQYRNASKGKSFYKEILTINNIYTLALYIVSAIIAIVRYKRGVGPEGFAETLTGSLIGATLKTMLDFYQGTADITAKELTIRVYEDIRRKSNIRLAPSVMYLYENIQTIEPYKRRTNSSDPNEKSVIKAKVNNKKQFFI